MDMKKIIFAMIVVAATMSFAMANGPADKPAAGGAAAGAGGAATGGAGAAATGGAGAAAGGAGAAAGGAGAAHAPSATTTASAPAPGPASAAVYSAFPAFGSLLGASLLTLFAYYFQ